MTRLLSATVTPAKTTRTRRRLSSQRNPCVKDGEANGPINRSSSAGLGFNAVLLSRIRSTKTTASSEEDERHSSSLTVNDAVSIEEHFNLQAFFPIVALPMS